MKLSVLERLMLLTVIPSKGNLASLKLIREAREKLSFTEKEHAVLKIRETGEGANRRVVWNEGVPDKEIEIGEVVNGMIVSELKSMEKKGELSVELLPIYEKFIT